MGSCEVHFLRVSKCWMTVGKIKRSRAKAYIWAKMFLRLQWKPEFLNNAELCSKMTHTLWQACHRNAALMRWFPFYCRNKTDSWQPAAWSHREAQDSVFGLSILIKSCTEKKTLKKEKQQHRTSSLHHTGSPPMLLRLAHKWFNSF